MARSTTARPRFTVQSFGKLRRARHACGTAALLLAIMVHLSSARSESQEAVFKPSPEQQQFLGDLQRDTFRYFWDITNPTTGLTPDRFPGPSASSIAAIGFALTAYPVGVEHDWISRAQAAERTLITLRFLWKAPQGPDAKGMAGYQGFFYHFLDARTGLRVGSSELSTVDTALLMSGVLAAKTFFDGPADNERTIRELADELFRRVDWTWAYSRKRPPLLSMGWTPEAGFLDIDWAGYSEAMIVYLLALGSPTHPINADAWQAWTATYRWNELYGYPHVSFGPLFGHQYSHVWVDFRGIQDAYMRARGIDYFVNSTRATYANRAYCIANPAKWAGYDDKVWGLTASDGPAPALPPDGPPGHFRAYWARGASPDDVDDGTIAPTAAGGSVPFAPEVTIPTLLHFRTRFGERLYGRYGFKDAFNLSFPNAEAGDNRGWFADQYVAIDQGPILLMVENFRTGMLWSLMARNPYVRAGLDRAGFTGGWLAKSAGETSQVSAAR